MKKNIYILVLTTLIGNSLWLTATVDLYVQNDTGKPIEFDRNNKGITYGIAAGARKSTPSELLESIYARYSDRGIYRKLSLGNAIKDAQKDGISSIIHVIPGTIFGVKVGKIDQVKDNITIPVAAKMQILSPLGLTLSDVNIAKFNKTLAAKILGISPLSTYQQAEAVYMDKARNRDKNVDEQVNDYRGYLLTKALKAFEI